MTIATYPSRMSPSCALLKTSALKCSKTARPAVKETIELFASVEYNSFPEE